MCRGLNGLLATLFLAFGGPCPAQEVPAPDEALRRLKEGNQRFVDGKPKERYINDAQWRAMVEKQQPIAVVLTCADSRSDPTFIFDKNLGELFKLRVAGNVTDPILIGSMEYAVAVLKSPLIVVLGHTRCGAVDAAVQKKDLPSDNLKQLIQRVHTGADLPKDPKEALNVAIKNNVRFQAQQLLKQSAILKDFAANKRIKIVAGVYQIETGAVEWLEIEVK